MQCDNLNHKRGKYDSYKVAIKDGNIYFKKGRIRLISSNKSLKTNFLKNGTKKLKEKQTLKNNIIQKKGVKLLRLIQLPYSITIE